MANIIINRGKSHSGASTGFALQLEQTQQAPELSSLNSGNVGRSSYYLDKEVLISDLELDGIKMPPVNMVVRSKKVIVTTPLAGGNQRPVNEIISNDLHEVRIAGRLIDEDGFPVLQLQEIIDLFEKNTELKVNCDYLRLFDIHQIVCQDIEYPDMAGTDNVAAFDLTAVSDTPIELELRDGIFS